MYLWLKYNSLYKWYNNFILNQEPVQKDEDLKNAHIWKLRSSNKNKKIKKQESTAAD